MVKQEVSLAEKVHRWCLGLREATAVEEEGTITTEFERVTPTGAYVNVGVDWRHGTPPRGLTGLAIRAGKGEKPSQTQWPPYRGAVDVVWDTSMIADHEFSEHPDEFYLSLRETLRFLVQAATCTTSLREGHLLAERLVQNNTRQADITYTDPNLTKTYFRPSRNQGHVTLWMPTGPLYRAETCPLSDAVIAATVMLRDLQKATDPNASPAL